jgi:hypothetical protein
MSMGQDGAALGRRDRSAANTRGPLGPGHLGGLLARRQEGGVRVIG